MADAAPWAVNVDVDARADARIAAHNAVTHNVHGIADTAALLLADDPRTALFGANDASIGDAGPAGQAGVKFGADVNLYRVAANVLATDDSVRVLGKRFDFGYGQNGAGHNNFGLEVGGANFAGTFDPVLYLGYNTKNGGQVIDATEPRASWNIEADYNDGAKRTIEQYLEIANADNSVVYRPLFVQVKRDAVTPETFVTALRLMGPASGMTFGIADDSQAGNIGFPAKTYMQLFKNTLQLFGADTTQNTVLRIDAAAAKASVIQFGHNGTADQFRWASDSDTVMTLFGKQGAVPLLHVYRQVTGADAAALVVGAPYDNSASILAAIGRDSQKGLVARAMVGGFGKLFEVQDSAGAYLSAFDENGMFRTKVHAGPPDANLAAGELSMWFDQTNGAAKVQFKAKQADGTVRTGSVALA